MNARYPATANSGWTRAMMLIGAVAAGASIAIVAATQGVGSALGLVAAIVFVFLLLSVPMHALALLILATIFFGEGFNPAAGDRFILYRLGIGGVYFYEVACWACLIAAGWANRSRIRSVPHAVVISSVIMASVIFVATAHGLLNGAPVSDALGYYEWRAWFLSLVLTVWIAATVSAGDVRLLLKVIVVLSAAHAAQGIIAMSLGYGDRHATEGVAVPFFDSGEGSLFGLSALLAGAYAIRGKTILTRWAWTAVSILLVATIVLDRRRNAIEGLAVAVLSAIIVGWDRRMAKYLIVLPIVFLAVDILPWTSWGLEAMRSVQAAAPAQGVDTTTFHIFDLADAGQTILSSPTMFAFGGGNGAALARDLTLPGTGVGGEAAGTGVIHSVYLTIWLRMGVIGVAAFIGALMAILRQLSHAPVSGEAVACYGAVIGFAGAFSWGTDLFGNTRFPILLAVSCGSLLVLSRRRAVGQRVRPVTAPG